MMIQQTEIITIIHSKLKNIEINSLMSGDILYGERFDKSYVEHLLLTVKNIEIDYNTKTINELITDKGKVLKCHNSIILLGESGIINAGNILKGTLIKTSNEKYPYDKIISNRKIIINNDERLFKLNLTTMEEKYINVGNKVISSFDDYISVIDVKTPSYYYANGLCVGAFFF